MCMYVQTLPIICNNNTLIYKAAIFCQYYSIIAMYSICHS